MIIYLFYFISVSACSFLFFHAFSPWPYDAESPISVLFCFPAPRADDVEML